MCNRSVGLVARAIDEAGIPTVALSIVREITEKTLPPRALFLRSPLVMRLEKRGIEISSLPSFFSHFSCCLPPSAQEPSRTRVCVGEERPTPRPNGENSGSLVQSATTKRLPLSDSTSCFLLLAPLPLLRMIFPDYSPDGPPANFRGLAIKTFNYLVAINHLMLICH